MNDTQNHASDDYRHLYPDSNQNLNHLGTYQENQEYKNYYQSTVPLVRPPKESKPKQPFSPIPLLLVAGVIFLFLGGIIFLTNTWDMLPDIIRALGLLSASVIAFSASALARKIFRLHKTGLAFYLLGCIFLPLAFGGIGVFQLFGEWFSFDGDGGALLWAVIFLSISASTFLGQRHYQNSALVWFSLSGLFGVWVSLDSFFINQILDSLGYKEQTAIFGILLVLYAVGASVIGEFYLKHHETSYITEAIPQYLYLLNIVTALFMLPVASDAELASGILCLILAVLFCNSRFISGKFHIGVFGSLFCLLFGISRMSHLFPDFSPLPNDMYMESDFLFPWTLTAVLLMGLHQMPKLREELIVTYTRAGMIITIPVFLVTIIMSMEEHTGMMFLLYLLLAMGVFFFVRTDKNKLSPESGFLALHLGLLFTIAMILTQEESPVLTISLILASSFLLIQAFLRRKLWPMTIAIGTCAAIMLLNSIHADILLLWLCALGMLAGVIYANKTYRYLLERACAWCFLAFIAPALQMTFSLWCKEETAWILTLTVTGVLYLMETFVFRADLRSYATKPYLEAESLLISFLAFLFFMDTVHPAPTGILLYFLLMIFAGGNCRKHVNAIAVPQLVMSFFTVNHMMGEVDSDSTHIVVYLVLLVIYATMGRLLLPDGFSQNEQGKWRIDWPLITALLPVFSVAFKIDWYPSILTCLFLALYSLLYTGRVKHPFMPSMMASAFACLAIFFHNVHDPFHIFQALHESDMKTSQVLLSLFPVHLFILSLLWILPPKYKPSVHKARFVMYCFTMFALLIASLSFGNVSDAILLMVFSFAILIGSFTVRKLRWFTLGFAVLFLTTLRLTWKFWTSLHWGIYLFLAGIILIAIASFTEYKNRYRAEHPDEPEKKLELFKTWTW